MKDKNIKPIKTGGIKPAPPQLTEEPLVSDCSGEPGALKKREHNRASIFTRFWWWLKDLFN